MEEIIVKASRQTSLLYLFGCAAFVAIGVYIVYLSEGWLPVLAGLSSVAFFGLGFFVLLSRGFAGEARILIDEEGIEDRLSGFGKIAWDDILFVQLRKGRKASADAVALKLKNSEKYAARLSGLRRTLAASDGDLDFGIVTLNLTGAAVKPEMLYRKIIRQFPEKQLAGAGRMHDDRRLES